MEYMAQFPDKYFDLAIVDPPYGIGISNTREIGYRGMNVFTPKQWDNEPLDEAYFNELFRVSKNQIIWGGNYFPLKPSRCFIIWDKGEGFYNRSYAEAELAWTSFDANVKIFKRDPLARGDYRGKIHPTQKPVSVLTPLIEGFTNPSDIVLDPFCGSGSTLVAARQLGRRFIGIELDAGHHATASRRVAETKAPEVAA